MMVGSISKYLHNYAGQALQSNYLPCLVFLELHDNY